jgi:hypothetical protein
MKQATKDKIIEAADELNSVSASEDLEVQEVIKKIKNALKEEEKSEK